MTKPLNKAHHQILAAVFEEQRQTHRPVGLVMIQIATNRKTPAACGACDAQVLELAVSGHLAREGRGKVSLTALGKAALEQAPATLDEPAEESPAPEPPRKPTPSLGPWPTQKAAGRAKRDEGNPLGGWKKRQALRDKKAPQVDETASQVDETARQASAKRQAAFQEWKRENSPTAYQEAPKINTPPSPDQLEAATEALQQVTAHAQQAAEAFRAAVAAMSEAARHLEELRR